MGRLTPLGIAVTFLCVAAPAAARKGAAPRARPHALVPLERVACLSPIPGQECTEDDHVPGLCTQCSDPPPRPPEPVIVDCRDPSIEWVQEMVGRCDMPLRVGDSVAITPERDGPREPACLESESCSAPRPPVAAGSTATDVQPVAVARETRVDLFPQSGRAHSAVLLRCDPGHPPRLLRPPDAAP